MTISTRTIGLLATTALLAGSASAAGLKFGFKSGFGVYATDAKGGGWVIHHIGGRGDTLWGCGDVGAVDTCTQVYFNEWKTASKMEMLHVSRDSHNAWFKLSAPGLGDYLYACKDPEGTPVCTLIDLEMRPAALVSLDRVWPGGECTTECDKGEGNPVDKFDPRYVIEDKARADMWLEMGVKVPGPTNLYACRNLAGEAECKLAAPNWLAFDRENLGFKKIEDIKSEGPDGETIYGPGVLVSKVDEETVAYEAGIREGTVITKVGDFEVNRAAHATFMMLQYPALDTFTITLEDGSTKEITARRKPSKK